MTEWFTCEVCGYSTTDERRMHIEEVNDKYVMFYSGCEPEDLVEEN